MCVLKSGDQLSSLFRGVRCVVCLSFKFFSELEVDLVVFCGFP